jgi:hypothetical protein
MSASTEQQQQFERDLLRLFEGGDGVVTFAMLSGEAAVTIIDAAMRGDARCRVIMAAAETLMERQATVEADAALACVFCQGHVLCRSEVPGGIAVLVPPELSGATIAIGICQHCAAGRSESQLTEAVVAKLRHEVMPGLRLLPLASTMPTAGHA